MKKNVKSRYWSTIVYPDSAPSDFIDILESYHIPIAISPLHDQDIDANGEVKKPHYHVLLCWENTTTENNVQSISDRLSGVLVVPVASVKGMYNYFTHKDNPEKYQYSSNDIVCLSGFSIEEYKNYTSSECLQFRIEIFDVISKNDIFEYSDLLDFLVSYNIDCFSYACNNTLLFSKYIDSRRHKFSSKSKNNL